MMLSTTCKAAIKAVVFLAARNAPGQRSSISEVAGHIAESEHTVGKMLQTLVRARLIKSIKGPGGGFFITEAQMNNPIIKIVECIDGKEVFKVCGLGLSKCSSTHPCPIHNEYKIARDLYEQIFRKNSIIKLCKPFNRKLTWLS